MGSAAGDLFALLVVVYVIDVDGLDLGILGVFPGLIPGLLLASFYGHYSSHSALTSSSFVKRFPVHETCSTPSGSDCSNATARAR